MVENKTDNKDFFEYNATAKEEEEAEESEGEEASEDKEAAKKPAKKKAGVVYTHVCTETTHINNIPVN